MRYGFKARLLVGASLAALTVGSTGAYAAAVNPAGGTAGAATALAAGADAPIVSNADSKFGKVNIATGLTIGNTSNDAGGIPVEVLAKINSGRSPN